MIRPPLALSHDVGASHPPLIEEPIGAHFDRVARLHPAREALVSVHQGLRYTYAELREAKDRLASGLLAAGLAPGDRLGIWSHNNAEWLIVQLATASIGLVLVNLNPAYRLAEIEYALNKVRCKALITISRFKTSDYLGMLRELAPEATGSGTAPLASARLPHLRTLIWIDGPGEADQPGMRRFSELMRLGRADDDWVDAAAQLVRNTDVANIQFTSGTTGQPKGAMLTHRNLVNNGLFVGEAMRFTPADRLCVPVPLYHCFGMVLSNLACLTHGSTLVYPSAGFDPLAVLQALQSERCTALHGVPAMFIAELDHPRFAEFDLSSLRTGMMAGSPCPIEVMKRVVSQMHMAEVTIAYGMTETSPASCQALTDDPLERRVSSVGRVLPHLEIKIIDAQSGLTVPTGTAGEFCTRGYSVMHGYWEDPARTAEAVDAEGWMHTGDLATLDSEGYVNIVGRLKDMVIRGGENIYPREIEEFLYRHPQVRDVQVVGVPDTRYGEELCAWIVARTPGGLTEAEIRDFCEGQIAHYKVPRHLRFVDALPMTATGKIQKFMIREAMIAELGLALQQTA